MPKNHRLPKSAFGRPPDGAAIHGKFSRERRLMLVEGIRAGLTKELAAMRARISEATFHAWLAKGREARANGWKPWPWEQGTDGKGDWAAGPLKKHSRELELLEACEKSEADRITEALLAIRSAGRGGEPIATEETRETAPDGTVRTTRKTKLAAPDWKAMSWIAEKTRPRDYGGIQRTEVSGPEGAPVQITSLVDLINTAAAQQEEEDRAKGKK